MNCWCDKLGQMSACYIYPGPLHNLRLSTGYSRQRRLHAILPTPPKGLRTLNLLLLLGSLSSWTPPPCPQLSKPKARVHPPVLPLQLIPHIQSPSKSYHSCLLRALESFHICHCYFTQVPISSYQDYNNSLLTALPACPILTPSEPFPAI